MLEIQELKFHVEYAPGAALVVPNALSLDAVDKSLYQRFYLPQEQEFGEVFVAMLDVGEFRDEQSVAVLRDA